MATCLNMSQLVAAGPSLTYDISYQTSWEAANGLYIDEYMDDFLLLYTT